MTNEQAYVVLENCASLLDSGTRFFTEDHVKQFHEAYELAMEALRKTECKPKKGRWIKCEDRAGWYCSECATDDYYAYLYNSDTGVYELQDKFCPSCGARMEE